MMSGDRASDIARPCATPAASSRPLSAPALDRVFKALASEVRREVLDALREGPMTTSDVVLMFPELSRFAVMQHLRVLVRARLVVARKRGRVRHNFLNPVPIQQLHERWVGKYESAWASALTGLKRSVEAAPAARKVRHDREGLPN